MVMWQFNGKYMILAATCYMNHIRSYARVLFRPFELTRYTVLLDARVLSTADITDHADVLKLNEQTIISGIDGARPNRNFRFNRVNTVDLHRKHYILYYHLSSGK